MVYEHNHSSANAAESMYPSFLASFSFSTGAAIAGAAPFSSNSLGRNHVYAVPTAAATAASGGGGGGRGPGGAADTFDLGHLEPEVKRRRMMMPAMQQAHLAAARTLSLMSSRVAPARGAAAAAGAARAAARVRQQQSQAPDAAAVVVVSMAMALPPSPPPPPRPCLVVGRGYFGGRVGLLTAMQPPELIKYLKMSGRS